MSWVEKDQPTPFDELPIPGLWYLDGDMVARVIQRDWTAGQKYPQVTFPSGKEFDIWAPANPEVWGIVHVYGEMDLPYKDTSNQAFQKASHIAEQVGYMVRRVGESGLEVWGHDEEEHFLITYDDEAGQMVDIQPLETTRERPVHPAHQLMTDELREELPELGANEEQGLAAPARVKYFTPDAGWSWFASEFDGQDLFFGLVVGLEIELGYFSLAELQSIRGPMNLPIERDLYFEPQSLEELRDYHRRLRGE